MRMFRRIICPYGIHAAQYSYQRHTELHNVMRGFASFSACFSQTDCAYCVVANSQDDPPVMFRYCSFLGFYECSKIK